MRLPFHEPWALGLAPDDMRISLEPENWHNYMLFKLFFPGTGVRIIAAVNSGLKVICRKQFLRRTDTA